MKKKENKKENKKHLIKNNDKHESLVGLIVLGFLIAVMGLAGYGIYNISTTKAEDDKEVLDASSGEVSTKDSSSKPKVADTQDPSAKLPEAKQIPEEVSLEQNNSIIAEYMSSKNINIKSQADIPLAAVDYKVTLKTNQGDIIMKLNKSTPITTGNFVALAKGGFYDGLIFHRVIEGFMIQGGDPLGSGMGGPGYSFEDEDFGDLKYVRGTVAMANSGPDTNGSQFFIMHKDTPLPPSYTIFGKVLEGLDVVDKIATTETDSGDKPVSDMVINSVVVEEIK